MDKYIDENPVALLAEGVDRNVVFLDLKSLSQLVALLAEGVDRNTNDNKKSSTSLVALLAEGVDRNVFGAGICRHAVTSPSSRRAWIEICWRSTRSTPAWVALLAEGVDRNNSHGIATVDGNGRPPRGGRG